jgi:hypothetical protein
MTGSKRINVRHQYNNWEECLNDRRDQFFERGRGLLLKWAHVGLMTQFPPVSAVSSYTEIRSETSLTCVYLPTPVFKWGSATTRALVGQCHPYNRYMNTEQIGREV